jgi:hypothetical protein
MEIKIVEIKNIIAKEEIQQREGLNEEYINGLSEDIVDGANFPPLDVYDIGGDLLLADGFHRLAAFIKAGFDTVEVNIIEGTERDAVLHAVGSNANHGFRRTNADKRKAVLTLLEDPEWQQWADTEIARRIVVTQPFVSKIRRELTQNGFECNTVRKCADGRVMDTSKIGAKPHTKESENSQAIEGSGSPQSKAETTNTNDNEEPHNSEENGVESSPDSESSDETGEADESDDQIEEGDSGTDGNDIDESDEPTSVDSDEEECIPDVDPEEQDAQEDEVPEPDGNGAATDETTVDADDDTGLLESEADGSQSLAVESSKSDEVQILKAKIDELENTIAGKDKRIEELEMENDELQQFIREFEAQQLSSAVYIDSIEDLVPAEELSNSPV